MILYALLIGKLPFDDPEIVKVLDKIKLGDYDIPEYLPDDLKNILTRLLCVDPAARITIDEIRLHPWYTSNKYISDPIPPLSPVFIPFSSFFHSISQSSSNFPIFSSTWNVW